MVSNFLNHLGTIPGLGEHLSPFLNALNGNQAPGNQASNNQASSPAAPVAAQSVNNVATNVAAQPAQTPTVNNAVATPMDVTPGEGPDTVPDAGSTNAGSSTEHSNSTNRVDETALPPPNRKIVSIEDGMRVILSHIEKQKVRAQQQYSHVQNTRRESGLLNTVLQDIENNKAADGGFNCAGKPEVMRRLANARNLGVQIPEQTALTREQTESLQRAVQVKHDELETTVRLQVEEIKQYDHTYQQLYQQYIGMEEQKNASIRKIIGNLNPRGA